MLAVTTGSMSQQALTLSVAEKRALAEYLSGKAFGAVAADVNLCTTKDTRLTAFASKPQWNGFGVDPSNGRFQTNPGLTAADVPNLKLKWAFGFPGGSQAYGNPAIVGGRIFVGNDTGTMYSLDAQTGCQHWAFKADAGIRSAPTVAPVPSTRSAQAQRHAVYFGDLKGNVFGLDAATGELLWKKQVDTHRFARVTGSVTVHNGRVYVPMSSVEEGPGAQANYECCTFRGSVTALDAANGNEIWKSYTITETPVQVGKNSKDVAQWAPAGAAVWSAPTIDAAKGVVY